MTLNTRLARLERMRLEPVAVPVMGLDLPPDLRARIATAQAAGTFPQSLSDADLEAIVAAVDVVRGQA